MRNLWNRTRALLRAMHKDEQGANMVEYILVIAAVALPLLGVVIWFWKDIAMKAGELYRDVMGGGGTDPGTINH
jgi:Flp pilus assembly pilin Flp